MNNTMHDIFNKFNYLKHFQSRKKYLNYEV